MIALKCLEVDTISARSGYIGNRIGNAEGLLIFGDIVSANLKTFRYDIGANILSNQIITCSYN